MWKGRTRDQKADLAKRITSAITEVTQAPPDATTIIFEDISKGDWAKGGELYPET